MGSGRIHKKIISKGSGEKAERGKLVRLKIFEPENSMSLDFGTAECKSRLHSEVDVLLGDGLDAPPAVELAAYEICVGGSVAIRAHADLRGELPEAFSIELTGKNRTLLNPKAVGWDSVRSLKKGRFVFVLIL